MSMAPRSAAQRQHTWFDQLLTTRLDEIKFTSPYKKLVILKFIENHFKKVAHNRLHFSHVPQLSCVMVTRPEYFLTQLWPLAEEKHIPSRGKGLWRRMSYAHSQMSTAPKVGQANIICALPLTFYRWITEQTVFYYGVHETLIRFNAIRHI